MTNSIVSTSSSFSRFPIHADLHKGISHLGFEVPTPIQESSIPPALEGRDVLACAMTGSGKTAAFLLPIMNRLIESRATKKTRGTRALILTPTRELAAQIHDHLQELGRFTTIRGAAVFGGVGMAPQKDAFMRGVDVIIATPGRLLDHFSNSYARLDQLEFLVLDEADRMLDMGFLPDVKRIFGHLPKTPRQTMLFSATMPEPIVALTREILRNPVAINIDRPSSPADGIEHFAYPVHESLKSHLLLHLLKQGKVKTAIVFTRTKHRANRLTEFLSRNKVACNCIHGNRSQTQRTAALGDFKNGKCDLLIATDIAARGIDVEALSHVINFDVPHISDDYIHRVGRTARAKMTGDAFTFVSSAEEFDFRAIEKAISKRIPRIKIDDFDYQLKTTEKLEIPLGERIAAIRAKKASDRARASAKVAAKQGLATSMQSDSRKPFSGAVAEKRHHQHSSRPNSGSKSHDSRPAREFEAQSGSSSKRGNNQESFSTAQGRRPEARPHRKSPASDSVQREQKPRKSDSPFSRYFTD